eukprot:CAMPEP_0206516446 /NCGR_PEP_ID=MMETSP0324_2-20121206/63380_1 /ASSEMBLY_ACC=CAM_ASM_000836 /TAXON_ID=2866 /ORGANISM="Crypthecodinium cohnii, Strain Seligo" /LENGTH=446 /DNA_ID=CAMNT_0054009397 /DNA_START=201 /DNA_END=1539 /DNA_ORIENTATION=+
MAAAAKTILSARAAAAVAAAPRPAAHAASLSLAIVAGCSVGRAAPLDSSTSTKPATVAAACEEDGPVNLLQQILVPRTGDRSIGALPAKLVQKLQPVKKKEEDPAQAAAVAKRRSDLLSLAEDSAASLRESRQVQLESRELELEALIEQEKIEEARHELSDMHTKHVKLQRSLLVVETNLHNAEKRNKALLIAAVGAAACVGLLAIIGCACAAWARPKKDSSFEGNLRSMQLKKGGAGAGARQAQICTISNNLSERFDDSLQSARRCMCCCSPKVALAAWSFAFLWIAVIVVLWKLGVVQPYLKNILLYGYFLFGIGSLVSILIWEYVHRLKNVFRRGYKTVMGFHDKIDDALESIGLKNLEQEDLGPNNGNSNAATAAAAATTSTRMAFTLDAAFVGDGVGGAGEGGGGGQAPAVGRTVQEAAARSAERKARNATRKPQPGSPAW